MKKLLPVTLVALFFSVPSSAALINLDTLVGWDIQDQVGTAPFFFDNSYTTSVGTNVKVTDLYVWGDEYSYFINDVNLGSIFAPTPAASYNADPDSAYASGLFASATFWLGANDVLTFQEITLPDGYRDGTIAISAGGTVPEPASLALMGLGLAGLGFSRRKAKSS